MPLYSVVFKADGVRHTKTVAADNPLNAEIAVTKEAKRKHSTSVEVIEVKEGRKGSYEGFDS